MWVTSGSFVGHIQIALWVKWVNKCDPLSTLSLIVIIISYSFVWLVHVYCHSGV